MSSFILVNRDRSRFNFIQFQRIYDNTDNFNQEPRGMQFKAKNFDIKCCMLFIKFIEIKLLK